MNNTVPIKDERQNKNQGIGHDTPKTSLQVTNNMDWRLEGLNEKQILQYFSLKIAFGANIMFTLEAAVYLHFANFTSFLQYLFLGINRTDFFG